MEQQSTHAVPSGARADGESRPGDAWPDPIDEAAYHGLAGVLVRVLGPGTEADPVALLVLFLAAVGNIVGAGPHWAVSGARHPLLFWPVLVGRTSRGRKGTAWGAVRHVLKRAVPAWERANIENGLSSGEGLIWRVRDQITATKPVREKGQVTGYQEEIQDRGIADKRVMVVEEEFGRVPRVMARDGNTLGAVLRNAWDGSDLSSMTKNSPAKATGAHVTVVGHVTQAELLRELNDVEAANGFANRFAWFCVRRSRALPDGGGFDEDLVARLANQLNPVLFAGWKLGLLERDAEANALWRQVYEPLSGDVPGLIGAITARAAPQVMRLATIYAVLDCSPVIRPEHLRAAVAIWDYAEASARCIFGDATGDPVADRILRELRTNGELTQTELHGLFRNNATAHRIDRATDTLLAAELVTREQRPTDGRPTTVWRAV